MNWRRISPTDSNVRMTVGRRLAWAVGLMVFLTTLVVGGLVWKVVTDRDSVARMELDALLEERLADLERPILQGLEGVERRLAEQLEGVAMDREALRSLRRTEPLALQVFALDERGRLVFPPEDETRSKAEADFVERTSDIWAGRAILYEPPEPEQSGLKALASSRRARSLPPSVEGDDILSLSRRREHGWIAWYWKDGLRLLSGVAYR